MKKIGKGICAPKGFLASGVIAGIRPRKVKKDLALIYSQNIATTSAVYTTNLVKGAPLIVTKRHLENGLAQAIICNSGNANTCNDNGIELAQDTCQLLENELSLKKEDVVVASTGVIGQEMSLEPFQKAIPELVSSLSPSNYTDCAQAILTTDTQIKEIAYEFILGDKVCHIGAIAKGSGMIHPNMATMLCFITSDISIDHLIQEKMLKDITNKTFNQISVDGDTSTNDMVVFMCNGMADNKLISIENKDYRIIYKVLEKVCTHLSKVIAKDGEGATKLIISKVYHANDADEARKVAKSVISSNLLKAAMFGNDANWGRVLCAIGYSGVKVDTDKIDVSFESQKGHIQVCHHGRGVHFDEAKATQILDNDEVIISIDLHQGDSYGESYGCDLTYDYVKINGDYRT